MTPPSSATLPHSRFAGLDGLRAVAVVLVVVYHLFPGWWLHSGFIGVDVFFVISGFLITSLLLRERERTGRIALVDFWRRRARRLLPALALVVTVCATWAWLVGGDVLVRLGWQVLGAATFSYNWISVAGGGDYFSADTPELLRNLWSLAVEEQFYWLWPLILPLLLLIPRRWGRAALALVAAVASALWMAQVVAAGGGLTRAYFGTDTHAFGLLLGVALAVGLQRVLVSPPAWLRHPGARIAGAVTGSVAVLALFALALLPEHNDVATFPGTLAAASVASAVAIVCGVLPGSWLGPVLDATPLRWIGDRSYGIYLWHWPLLVLVSAMAGVTAGADTIPPWVGSVALVLTAICATVSYRFVEQPVRRLGFRGALGRCRDHLVGPPRTFFPALGVLLASIVVVAGTTAGIATAPATSSGQAVVQQGRTALAQPTGPRPPLVAEDASSPDSALPQAPAAVDGRQIDAIGDSVMLASAPALMEKYPGIRIDAKVSRSIYAAPGIVDRLAAQGTLRRYVVLGLGTNGSIDKRSLDLVVDRLGPHRRLVLVTAFAPRSWIPGVNKALHAYAAGHPTVIVADWAGAIAPHVDLLAGDQIHPGGAGGRIYAQTVADAITQAQRQQAAAREQMTLRAYDLAEPRASHR
ncbi:acyltransferase family protein [Microbacterium luticocti]|uniref:acyltransferase family protein n=1 Tax=Microbacterium luticocti TaxID=451764 RepID=UPI0006862ECF|nr:acyltransferase family protein [Microbacterium luticocti]